MYLYRKPRNYMPPRYRGNATMLGSDGNPLYDERGRSIVKVTYADGSTRVASPNEFRPVRTRKHRKIVSQGRGIETARINHGHDFNS